MEDELRTLMLAGLDGDAVAYRRFLQRASTLLRGLLRRRMGGLPDEVEDVLQEILLAIHEKRHTWRRDEPLTPWLRAIARYKLMDCFRRRAHREALHEPLDDDGDWLVATNDDEWRRDLDQLLQRLPDGQRVAIEHTKLAGLSVAETAQRTGMSPSAVKVNVHRGIRALARWWKESA